jgi:hypothetical protein
MSAPHRRGTGEEAVVEVQSLIRGLGLVILALAVADVVTHGIRATGHDHAMGLIPLFDISEEQNVPTYFTALLWIWTGMAMLTLATFRSTGRVRFGLSALSLVCGYLAFDELFQVHEEWDTVGERLSIVFFGVAPYFAWIIVGAIVALGTGLLSLTIFWQLDRTFRRRLVVAGAVFVASALGIEGIESAWTSTHGFAGLYQVLVLVEECLEMTGVLLAFRACLLELERTEFRIRLR